ncbi:NAD-dependent epimerase/dehydratase family protein [Flavobacteriaceae bacterium]|nr:NAD-dependent epimerase/dehydratase family protein [Flavobacteriaceae bacterium]
MKGVTVIGGSGFVGSKLISELDLKECQNIDKNPSPFFNNITTIGDIRLPHQINLNKEFKTVVLLAAEHRDDVSPTSLYYDVNVQGTRNILDKMDSLGIKQLVFTSSVAIYGLNKVNPDESHLQDPFNHYGKSKWQAEEVIKDWYDKDPEGKSVTILRPTVIFGERNRGNVYNLLKQISSGKFLMIGKGQNKKSMAYVGNIVAFIKNRLSKEQLGYHVFNYADKPDYNMNELVFVIENKMKLKIPKFKIPYWLGMFGGFCFDFLSKVTGKKLSISSVRIKKFCATTQFDSTKAHNSFNAPYSLKEALNQTLENEFVNPKKDDILFYSE